MTYIQSINKPDISKVKPRMSIIHQLVQPKLEKIVPVLKVECDDNLRSNVNIKDSFDREKAWKISSFHTSRCFRFSIVPQNEK